MKNDNRGMTLVEVVAGFLLLVVVMTSFIKIIQLSSRLTTISSDAKSNNLEFEEKYYSGINYTVKNGNYAFRTGDSVLVPGFGNNSIFIAECTIDTSVTDGIDFVERTDKKDNKWTFDETKKTYVSKAELIRVENLYDTNISRLKVYRYYMDRPQS